jgi:hypothetical protein
MPRFVILEHDWPEKHWDFMLEAGPVLETWKLPSAPKPGVTFPTKKSFDHRLMYLDYEGPISGGRGSVTRWDAGTYMLILGDESNRLLQLQGIRLQGMVEIKGQEDRWTCNFTDTEGPSWGT